jgi:prepilin-type N-terminal cleavage/methylation domain-containing protein
MKRKRPQYQNQQGFTLIELMVSLSLFVIVVLAAVASLYTVNNASKKVQAMRTSLDNLNFAIESMSRTIRTGTNLGCNGGIQDCSISNGNTGGDILLQSTLGYDGVVRFIRDDDCFGTGTGCIVKQKQGQTYNASELSITSPEIDIQNMIFYVDGTDPSDGRQPSVIMFLQGTATAGGAVAPFAIQTYVSQRTFE